MSFDRAAGYYDRTRSLPSAVAEAQTRVLSGQLNGARRCLEIGVGTGRIAVPLAAAGTRIVGVDLSAPMLAELAAKNAAVPALLADARALPFAADTFDAALACHVLHLIGAWRAVVGELIRVVRPGGQLLASQGGDGACQDERLIELRRRLRHAAGLGDGSSAIGLRTLDELDARMADRGASVQQLPAIANPGTQTVQDLLDETAAGCWSWTWRLDADTLRRAVDQVRSWAADEWGDLRAVQMSAPAITWRVYRLSA